MQDDKASKSNAGQGAQPQACGEGAPLSNTAPANSNRPQILMAGMDSLYLSVQGSISLEADIKLRTLKALAQGLPHEQALAVYSVLDHRFEVWGKGSGLFPYVLVDHAYYIKLCGLGSGKLPLAYIQVKSAWLMEKGVECVCAELLAILKHLGEVEGELQVSRVDLYVDFVLPGSFDVALVGQWVSRARLISQYSMDRIFSGISIGLGGDISARLYDKTLEIKESGKEYMRNVWTAKGWTGEGSVYRLELQIKRRVLSEHEVKTVPDLLCKSGALWRYATLNWLKFVIPISTDATQSRWPLHPVWEALAMVDWPESHAGISLPIRHDRAPSDRTLYVNGLSGLTSFMARAGITDIGQAVEAFISAARSYHNYISHFTGQDFEGYVQEKAALKARQYNLKYPFVDEKRNKELTHASADAYRKIKDGE